MVFTLGFVFLFGKVIALCNGAFYRNFGSKGRAVCYATGFIGTPVHEASHALMCLIFGHKIVEIKFFQPNSSDGTLGYVRHSYNPKNIYQKVGCLFIGIAPVLVGALILAGLLYLLLPELFGAVSSGGGLCRRYRRFVRAYMAVFLAYVLVYRHVAVVGIPAYRQPYSAAYDAEQRGHQGRAFGHNNLPCNISGSRYYTRAGGRKPALFVYGRSDGGGNIPSVFLLHIPCNRSASSCGIVYRKGNFPKKKARGAELTK